MSEPIYDSPTGWVAKHIEDYVRTGGAEGHMWSGTPTLLLTTRGRVSGKLRRTALIYGKDGDTYVVVASIGGSPKNPQWYFNLVENPEVELQVADEVFAARARTATPEEKPRLWAMMAEIFPTYNEYQAKTERDIPVIILERI